MSSILQIAQGWHAYATASPRTKLLMEQRLAVCDTCPFRGELGKVASTIVRGLNPEGSILKCTKCTCPLSAKTACTTCSCPIGKWGPQSTDSFY